MQRYRVKDMAADLCSNAVPVLIGTLVVWGTSWDRSTVYLAALAIGWAARLAVQRRRPDQAPHAAGPDAVRR